MLVGIILAAISWAPLGRSRLSLIVCAVDGCVGVVILGPLFNVLGMVSNGTIHSPVRLNFFLVVSSALGSVLYSQFL